MLGRKSVSVAVTLGRSEVPLEPSPGAREQEAAGWSPLPTPLCPGILGCGSCQAKPTCQQQAFPILWAVLL